ncbi:deoxyribonuclease gamma-like isoform X2 [Sphaeramia orbicularis]|uniref:deoxyribonuclease gamma-like isoform X2 n=1 Tax=Sphaeramia orbicularis TaxID=375764 RepID=UPI00117F4983|nr:deoxyribonuclease gamma-like isoform X2 [Sphaeramia orbicularis]
MTPVPPHVRLLVLVFVLSGVSAFKICSYNVEKLSGHKAKNFRIMHTLTRVLSHYDLCLLLDVDSSAVRTLLAKLNRYDDQFRYDTVTATSLDTNHMHHYVYFYRTKTVNVKARHQYQKVQSFTREPLAVQIHSRNTAIRDFILVPLHSEPSKAVQEMDRLYDVFQEVSRKWNNTNVMFLGDFHAGCTYMTRADKKKIRLFRNTSFSWLIGDKVDTTVTDDTTCPYDRIVVHGERFLKNIKPLSGQVVNIGKRFRVRRTLVQEISNHYPLEVILKSSALLLQATPLLALLSVVIAL